MVFDRKLGKSFKKVGKSYHAGRKDYPKKLIEDIIKISKISKDSLVLDVGCGTGKSTIPFAKMKSKIIGIDISENMLKIARIFSDKYKNLSYKKISFEKFASPASSFDLILFGTAIHWLDPKIVYGKTGNLLKKTGYVALFWEPIGSLCKKIRLLGMENLFIKTCPNYPKDLPISPAKIKIEGIMKTRFFAKPLVKKYKLIKKYTQEEFLSLVSSYSWVISLNKKKKNQLMREVKMFLGKKEKLIKFHTELYLIMAKRK